MVFFFSSRRRHTRLVSDWSSDVCSSDLDRKTSEALMVGTDGGVRGAVIFLEGVAKGKKPTGEVLLDRSEERRVGKECKCRWSRAQCTKKRAHKRSTATRPTSASQPRGPR